MELIYLGIYFPQ